MVKKRRFLSIICLMFAIGCSYPLEVTTLTRLTIPTVKDTGKKINLGIAPFTGSANDI